MPRIEPFRALRYNPDRISFISRVVAPPYDLIDVDLQEELLGRDPCNVVRLVLGKPPEGGRERAAYQSAAQVLARWRDQQILFRDPEPAVYVCEQEFDLGERRLRRVGFVARLLLEKLGEGGVFPHEHTMEGPKRDRVELMRACRANLSQVFAIYSDPDGRRDRLVREMRPPRPIYEYRDESGVANIVSKVNDAGKVDELKALMRDETLCIADGHHRYETALTYRDEVRPDDAPPGSVPEDYTTVLLVSVADEGLTIFPTHRLVRAPEGFQKEDFVSWLKGRFTVREIEVPVPRQCGEAWSGMREEGAIIGCYLARGRLYGVFPDGGGHEVEDALPVCLLTEAVIQGYLGMEPGQEGRDARIEYKSRVEHIYWAVESGRYDVGFLLPSLDPAQVQQRASSGRKLPPKSTYFYPKMPSGLLMYPFDEPD